MGAKRCLRPEGPAEVHRRACFLSALRASIRRNPLRGLTATAKSCPAPWASSHAPHASYVTYKRDMHPLTHKLRKVESGEIGGRWLEDWRRVAKVFA